MEQRQEMELEELEQQVTNLDIKMEGVDRKVDNILFLLAGSEYDKNNGLVVKVTSQGERIDKLEKTISRWQWTVVGTALPAALWLLDLVKTYFRK